MSTACGIADLHELCMTKQLDQLDMHLFGILYADLQMLELSAAHCSTQKLFGRSESCVFCCMQASPRA